MFVGGGCKSIYISVAERFYVQKHKQYTYIYLFDLHLAIINSFGNMAQVIQKISNVSHGLSHTVN